jgi:dGTPase
MNNQEILKYRGALQEKKFQLVQPIQRISFNADPDQDLTFEGIIDPFEIDTGKILQSKTFRREHNKTQVVYSPENPDVRTRSSHTYEVVTHSAWVCQILGLNDKLASAIAWGHDLGHGPTGHLFEKIAKEYGVDFLHEVNSVLSAVYYERSGRGLNLTRHTLEGILTHSSSSNPFNIEKNNEDKVVMYCDKTAYVFSDINDLKKRFNAMDPDDLKMIRSYFPGEQRDQVNACILSLVKESSEKGYVSFEESETAQNFKKVKKLMYDKYYLQFDHFALETMLKADIDCLKNMKELEDHDAIILASQMTDEEVHKLYYKIVTSLSSKITKDDLRGFGIYESIQKGYLAGKKYPELVFDLKVRLKS